MARACERKEKGAVINLTGEGDHAFRSGVGITSAAAFYLMGCHISRGPNVLQAVFTLLRQTAGRPAAEFEASSVRRQGVSQPSLAGSPGTTAAEDSQLVVACFLLVVRTLRLHPAQGFRMG